ncbi:MAG: type II toxin-antitoxin system prevent-host-death family antitoxin [Acidobacteria bacterium]|nr:type II toxin-antitoxin system prevent-host-death family antitoxin [Acidobacteriota bacterium]
MPQTWSLQEAKNRFSEVVNRALDDGTQVVTRHGRETAVVISIEDYQRLKRPATGLVEFFRSSPLCGVELELTRDLEREGKRAPAVDGMIAATAKVHGLTVVTRNAPGLAPFDVPLLNPWETPTPSA